MRAIGKMILSGPYRDPIGKMTLSGFSEPYRETDPIGTFSRGPYRELPSIGPIGKTTLPGIFKAIGDSPSIVTIGKLVLSGLGGSIDIILMDGGDAPRPRASKSR